MPPMRFRAKFEKMGWFWVAMLVFFVISLWFSRSPPWPEMIWILTCLLNIYNFFSCGWKLDSDGLHQKTSLGLSASKILWKDVERIGLEDPQLPSSPLVIDYSQIRSIRLEPVDRAGFLSALRQHAPQANFEI